MSVYEEEKPIKRSRTIKSVYVIKQGHIVDHLIDNHDINYKLNTLLKNSNMYAFAPGDNERLFKEHREEQIHSDFVGEYKRETIKI